jgi:hypothetical protein
VTAGRGIDELGQDGEEEDGGLGVGDADHEAVGKDAAGPGRRRRSREGVGQRAPVADRLHAEEDQVGGADQLPHGEQLDRALDQGADPERDGDDLEITAGGVAGDRQEGAAPADDQRAADREQDARARHGDQHQRGQREGEEAVGRHRRNSRIRA